MVLRVLGQLMCLGMSVSSNDHSLVVAGTAEFAKLGSVFCTWNAHNKDTFSNVLGRAGRVSGLIDATP